MFISKLCIYVNWNKNTITLFCFNLLILKEFHRVFPQSYT